MDQEKVKYISSFSGGKDSTVDLWITVKYDYPLDEVICAVLPFEEPDILEHLKNVDNWYFKETGKRIIFLKNDKPIENFMGGILKRGINKGIIRGFPLAYKGFCWISRDYKINLLTKWEKEYSKLHNCKVHKYLGFAVDEKNNLRKLKISNYKKGIFKFSYKNINYDISNESYPLVDLDYTEEDCRQQLKIIGLWCNTHFDYNRSGCWCCPKQSKQSRLKAINSNKRIELIERWCKISGREIYPDLTLNEIKTSFPKN